MTKKGETQGYFSLSSNIFFVCSAVSSLIKSGRFFFIQKLNESLNIFSRSFSKLFLLVSIIEEFEAFINQKTQIFPTAWVNINSPGSFNLKHSHPTSDLSGVLWIKCPENCGNIWFESPMCYQTFKEIESYTQDFKDKNRYDHSYWLPPMEGRIIIFPSHLEHDVRENLSNEDRISVSFNIKLEVQE